MTDLEVAKKIVDLELVYGIEIEKKYHKSYSQLNLSNMHDGSKNLEMQRIRQRYLTALHIIESS